MWVNNLIKLGMRDELIYSDSCLKCVLETLYLIRRASLMTETIHFLHACVSL